MSLTEPNELFQGGDFSKHSFSTSTALRTGYEGSGEKAQPFTGSIASTGTPTCRRNILIFNIVIRVSYGIMGMGNGREEG